MEAIVALIIVALVVIIVLMLLSSAIRVVQQYERGVIFVLGKLTGAKGPGIFLVPPFITRMTKVDLRVVTLTVPPQEVISRDNVTIKVTAVVYFYVVDPVAAVVNVMNYMQATTQIGQTTLRNVLGQSELDELLSQRNKINRELQTIIDEHTERWGVKVTAVEIKDVELPSTMLRAMAKQAEAEREKRSKIIHAEGEFSAAQRLVDAAHAQGLAVVLDCVYNHLGPEGNYLSQYGPYFTDTYRTPWGWAINFDGAGSDHVRRYFVENLRAG